MAKSSVTMTKDMLAEVMSQIRELTKTEVLVGIPDANAGRDPEPGEKHEPISNAEIGYVMEFGMPEKNIPARPFLVPGVQDARDRIGQQLETGARKALAGDPNAADITLNKAGLTAQNAVRAKIEEGPFVPLAPRTLAQRKKRGRTGEKPLIDTGQLRKSITYVIVEKGK
jgi:phage gpG-like protein